MSFFDNAFVADASQAQASFEPIPEGDYSLVIESAKMDRSKAGDEMLKIQMKVDGGDFDNRKLFVNLCLEHSNEQTVQIAKKKLHALLVLTETAQITDASDLIGKSFTTLVTKTKRKDNPNAWQNEVILAVRKDGNKVAPSSAPTSAPPASASKPANGTWG